MSLIFKVFWHIIPYSLILIYIHAHSSVQLITYVLVGLCMSFSTLKADAYHRKSKKIWLVSLMVAEAVLIMKLQMQTQVNAEFLALIVLVDFFWYNDLKKKITIYFAPMLLFLSIAVFWVTRSPYALFIPLFSMWVGLSLRELENKKENAQKLYDRLRSSEEALKKANHELEAYYDTLEEVVKLRERTRISRDIHDSVGHALATTLIQLQAIEHRLKVKNDPDAYVLSRLVDFMRDALESTRNIVHNMVDSTQANKHFKEDLQDMVQGFSNRTGKEISLVLSDNFPLVKKNVSDTIYRIIQESLTNALKHSNATQMTIILSDSEDALLLTIQDNGIGKGSFCEGFGMLQMKKRISEINGEIEFSIHENTGLLTKLTILRGEDHEFTISG